MKPKIAVLIPCYNEEKSVAPVIRDAKKYLPGAEVYVYDNNSTDKTADVAREAGAIVCTSSCQGKGSTVQRMFSDIDADVYVMTDGDTTYDLSRAPELIDELIDGRLDMVVGARREKQEEAYRRGHRFGNFMLTRLVQIFFKQPLKDMLSGFRVFSKRFVKTFPAHSPGFEIETELTVFTCSSRLPFKEIETDYFARPEGSESKLSTYRDGFKILLMIINLIKEERPLFFFSVIAAFLALLSIGFAVPLFVTYAETGLVPKLPTAVLSTGLMICAIVSLFSGFVLDTIAKTRQESRRQAYLRYPLYKRGADK
ncbi:MAG: glycosyltransferase family 2 protein [Alphaproteobacteria bacterium]|jgi:glycosyltransferase involved in cell wall biosynthesis